MAAKKPAVTKAIIAKARQLLQLAELRAEDAPDWLELNSLLFGVGGKANELFATESERNAFCKTLEYKRLLALMDRLPRPIAKKFVKIPSPSANGRSSN